LFLGVPKRSGFTFIRLQALSSWPVSTTIPNTAYKRHFFIGEVFLIIYLNAIGIIIAILEITNKKSHV
jgi:hypothetical protein